MDEKVKRTVPVVAVMDLKSMSPTEARVLVAKDVLALLDAEVLRVSYGEYMPETSSYVAPDTPMHQIVDQWLADDDCTVCALGAALVASVRRFNACTYGGVYRGGVPQRRLVIKYLEQLFSQKQIDLIEYAFEEWAIGKDDFNDDEVEACTMFSRAVQDCAKRFRAIFENIAVNDGTFDVVAAALLVREGRDNELGS